VRSVIILFAKAPVAGQVKTRLVPPLTPAQAASLHTAFVKDMMLRMQAVPGSDVELHTDTLTDAWTPSPVAVKCQCPGDLALKMVNSLNSALRSGFDRAVILGSDAPTVPLSHVEALIASAAEIALGPARDGGFWGISAARTDPRMFNGVHWSARGTLCESIAAARQAGLTVELGPAWFDVDEPADLDGLLADPDLPPHTRAWRDRCYNPVRNDATRLAAG
jgi:rSAM/selenodomain-associated transferase 1